MRRDKALRLAGLWSPSVDPCFAVLKIRQTLLPIGGDETLARDGIDVVGERQRDDTLKKVLEAADNVRRWGDAVTIGPFNAFDRRVIHLHMEKDRELEAVSEGDGDEAGMKKMIIRVREKPAG